MLDVKYNTRQQNISDPALPYFQFSKSVVHSIVLCMQIDELVQVHVRRFHPKESYGMLF